MLVAQEILVVCHLNTLLSRFDASISGEPVRLPAFDDHLLTGGTAGLWRASRLRLEIGDHCLPSSEIQRQLTLKGQGVNHDKIHYLQICQRSREIALISTYVSAGESSREAIEVE